MDDSIEEVSEKAHIGLLEEDSESIKSVLVKYKISVKEKKSVQEVEHDLDQKTLIFPILMFKKKWAISVWK